MFNGNLNTNTVSGVSLVGKNFTFNSGMTTSAAGPLTVTNSGVFTVASGIALNVAGAFNESGIGTNVLAGQITAGGSYPLRNLFPFQEASRYQLLPLTRTSVLQVWMEGEISH